jgi:membrane glycosyltransferase
VLAGASKRRDPVARPAAGAAGLAHRAGDADLQRGSVRTTAALQAMGEALGASMRESRLRDRDAVGLHQRRCLDPRDLERRPAAHGARAIMPVWYRRRWRNIARKSGNLEDFVTRWGGRYDHMIVLDADSLIDAPTLQRLVHAMQADPALGILQTAPQLIGARTLFGRLQQFAACVYGPVITRGLAAWSGDSGNYWGHNAIIRVAAFAQSCGLPKLKGRKPFGGTCCRTISSRPRSCAAAAGRCAWPPTAAAPGKNLRPR